MDKPGNRFDRDLTIAVYREVIADCNRSNSAELRQDYEAIARRLRAIWSHWHGSDTLHQAAFPDGLNLSDESALRQQPTI